MTCNDHKNKLNLVAYLSHELRTPLNALLGFSEAIKEEMYGPLENEKYQEYIHHIYETAISLSQMVDSFLDLTKYESGYLTLREEEVDLENLLRLCIHQMEGYSLKSTECVFNLKVKGPVILYGDPLRLKQIFLNLLSNACKFSPPKGVIEIHLEKASPHDEPVVRIRDHGTGMTEEEIDAAFKPFEQGFHFPLGKPLPGTGLGLPLAKKLTEAHGGTLVLKSQTGEGTTCLLTFPQERSVRVLKKAA